VLWLDSDLAWYPPDIVQLLMRPGVEMAVPHCLLGSNTCAADRPASFYT
jgi:hypothetical protein